MSKGQIIGDIQVAKSNISATIEDITHKKRDLDKVEVALVEEWDNLNKAEKLFNAIPDQEFSHPSPTLGSALASGSYLAEGKRDHSEYVKEKFVTYMDPSSLMGTANVSNISSGMVLNVAESAATLVAPQYLNIQLVLQEVKLPSLYEKVEKLKILLGTLDSRLSQTLDGAFQILRDRTKLDRHRQAAESMRDLIKNILNLLAPHEKVKRAEWFRPGKNTRGKPTRRQRVKYAIMGSQSEKKIDDEDLVEIDRLIGDTVKVYGDLSSFHSNDAIDRSDISILTGSYLRRCVDLIYSILELRKKNLDND